MSRRSPTVAYLCPSCGAQQPLARPLWRCPVCHSHLNCTAAPGLDPEAIDSSTRSLWRYRAALAVADRPRLSLGEGGTPLVSGRFKGASVQFKLDFLNPSGSFKDRGIAVMVAYLAGCGVDRVAEDSSGNAGASLATYTAAYGLACRILVPAATSAAKTVQIAAAGAEVVRVPGSRQDVAEAAVTEAERAFYASHNWHPLFLEGTKTLGFELWEDLGFRAPDNIVVPSAAAAI